MSEPAGGWRRGAGGSDAGENALPPGIRSWQDGRVFSEAMRRYRIVAIGCSKGGMHALDMMFRALPKDFPLPIIVVQHRYRTSNDTLPAYFRRHAQLPIVDATDKQWIQPGHVYFAPADYHLLVDPAGELSLSVDERVEYARPSIDVLFESAAEAFTSGVVGVVLTGANADGASGVQRIKQRGGFVIVQDPETAEAAEMPRAAIGAVRVDRILPLDRIGPFLVELSSNSR
ncbi:MAG TPA: chemotaxis protein CheB [Thermoanaerobaculia bacterium]|nr:chemotaxis protein CheB [Thermoanaerobaculia bacterium]